jgi:transcriptional regulator with XRE-family HTH domain
MSRKDENGRSLESLLTYMLDGVSAGDIAAALGVSHATYYRRKAADDYPNAEDLRLIAEHFDLNPIDLMVRFGLIPADAVESWSGGSPLANKTKARRLRVVTPRVNGSVDLNGPSL